MKKKFSVRNLIKAAAFVSLTALLIWGLTRLMQPKFYFKSSLKTPETELWKEFYSLPENEVEVLFLGASSSYCGIDAPEISRITGLKTYVLAASSARLYDNYYMLREALRFQTPKLVVLEIGTIRGSSFGGNIIYKRIYDDMKWSSVKLEALKGRNASLEKKEPLINRFFTLLDFHSRWNELTDADFFPQRYQSIQQGFVACEDIGTDIAHDKFHETTDQHAIDSAIEYYSQIVRLCHQKGIPLVTIRVPSPGWSWNMHEEAASLAEDAGLLFVDYNDDLNYPRIGIDDTNDWRDGAHLNRYGASKFAPVLAEDLKVWAREAGLIN